MHVYISSCYKIYSDKIFFFTFSIGSCLIFMYIQIIHLQVIYLASLMNEIFLFIFKSFTYNIYKFDNRYYYTFCSIFYPCNRNFIYTCICNMYVYMYINMYANKEVKKETRACRINFEEGADSQWQKVTRGVSTVEEVWDR